jgi:regulator of cell morphogenesis and NO signaling
MSFEEKGIFSTFGINNFGMQREKTIEQIISENHFVAEGLHFLGIHFHNYSEKTLAEVCKEKGLQVETVIEKINSTTNRPHNTPIKFDGLSDDLLIEYLKHNHYIFIKQRLPFIMSLIKNFEGDFPELKSELKLVFPLFVEDFVTHIYEEEDTLFSYILLMHNALDNKAILNKVQAKMMDNSIKQFQADHEVHDDHLKGLRRLTNDFEIIPTYDLNTKVVLTELKKLDEELHFHAKVENNILFPRALELERKVLALLRSKIALN